MKAFKKIKGDNLSVPLPITGTVVTYLLLDKYHAPSWLWWECGIGYAIVWICSIIALVNTQQVDVIGKIQEIEKRLGDY